MTRYLCYAKLNLLLQVCGRRDDGYHELRTVFQTIDLADEIEIGVEPAGDGLDFRVVAGGAPEGDDNLVVRAVRRFRERWPFAGRVRVGLRKRIPMGGGLGGGSSDAATTLLALRDLIGRPASVDALRPVARDLGADVPYFLVGGTALGTGRGDEVVPLPELAPTPLVVITPSVQASTAEVFAALGEIADPGPPPGLVRVLAGDAPPSWSNLAGRNDLQAPVLQKFSAIRKVYDTLQTWGATEVRLTGSGSSFFCRAGVEFGDADVLRSRLQLRLPGETLITDARTIDRDQIARRGRGEVRDRS